jgi:hypothetical protein
MIALRIIPTIINNASQFVASTKPKHGDGKTGNSIRDKDQIADH